MRSRSWHIIRQGKETFAVPPQHYGCHHHCAIRKKRPFSMLLVQFSQTQKHRTSSSIDRDPTRSNWNSHTSGFEPLSFPAPHPKRGEGGQQRPRPGEGKGARKVPGRLSGLDGTALLTSPEGRRRRRGCSALSPGRADGMLERRCRSVRQPPSASPPPSPSEALLPSPPPSPW